MGTVYSHAKNIRQRMKQLEYALAILIMKLKLFQSNLFVLVLQEAYHTPMAATATKLTSILIPNTLYLVLILVLKELSLIKDFAWPVRRDVSPVKLTNFIEPTYSVRFAKVDLIWFKVNVFDLVVLVWVVR